MRALVIALLLAFASAASVRAEEPVDYLKQIKPLLATRCYACHGALKQESGLRLDTVAAITTGGDGGAILSSGNSRDSAILERVTHDDADLRMPPEGEGAPFTADEVALLSRWIDQGAKGPADEKPEPDPREHWSFRAPVRPELPDVKNQAWVRNPIDAFLAAEHERQGVTPQRPADKRILLRRVYLDLIGLPPSRAETEGFLSDPSDDAYEKVVNRLLESPQYGERWGRHWMDVWRYSDWWGLGAEVRNSQKHIWHWRDWIVESLNDDHGYDEMLRQMLAADELYPNDLDKLRATGFLARQYFKFNRNSWMEETVEHTSKSFLGMTFNCARCHDHKYDPISQRDYYRFRAFFEPYQVRTEQISGELDYERGGIPRAFDCNLDAPTHLFRRGDEKQPVTEEPLLPGLPGLLSFEDLKIEPTPLPAEAHQPGLRPWVLENHLAAAEKAIASARQEVEKAKKTLAEAEQRPGTSSPASEESKPLVSDDFKMPEPELWEALAGEWKHERDRLIQSKDGGDLRGVYQLKQAPPEDFVATVRFTTTGGKQWKSAGLSFDMDGDHDILVYLSAFAGGSKLQVAPKQNGTYLYPAESAQARSVKVGEPQEMTVRVRGKLVNVEINGEHAVAYRLPIERREGKLALITFDAQAEFERFTLAALPATTRLREPAGASPPAVTVEQAKAALAVAERAFAFAQLQPDLWRSRAAADRVRFSSSDASETSQAVSAAAKAERLSELAKAEENLVRAELELLASEPAKKEEVEKKLTAAREAVERAKGAVESPGESYTSLKGALKTAESNVEPPEHYNRPFPTTSSGRRTALAHWMTDRRHPLTARVAVNHMWLRHMGAPLVPTVFEFGRKGQAPTHPELLDYLAVELIDSGWSMKHLHRLIVTSNAYRMSSSAADAEANLSRDPENRHYWRMNSTRMESQVVRDCLLSLAGELDPAMGGPSVPFAQTEQSKRRSLYFVHSHNEHDKLLSIFDDANVLDCYRREQSIVPQQALALSNSRLSLEAAAKIASRIGHEEDEPFLREAFLLLLATEPNDAELAACREALAAWSAAGVAPPQARANLVQALLNHNDFLTVR
jgi:hypothetical protein